jgi:hypothetical protein
MGYLNKETITVDAILTRKGRELLAQGRSAFQITQFAVSDDEIDYELWNPAHPLGTEYYGWTIENMPIVEASPDETQNLRYKLVSLAKGLNTVPRISLGGISALQFNAGLGGQTLITPETKVGARTSELDGPDFGYTLTLANVNAATVSATPIIGGTVSDTSRNSVNATTALDTALVLVGTSFTILPKDVDTIIQTTITISGNQSGATITIPVTVIPSSE